MRDALELVRRNGAGTLGQTVSEPELFGDSRATRARNDVRPDLGEPSLGRVSEAIEDRARDRELENAVAEELEPLVGGGAVVRPRRVRKDLLEPVRRQLGDQPAELGRSVFRVLITPGER